MKHAVKLVSESAGSYTVGGYGVVWGGKDLRGEWFEKDYTDLWLDRVKGDPMLMYDHGFDDGIGKAVLGHVVTKRVDDVGLWIEGQIQKASEYADMVMALVNQGVLGLSTGSIQHIAEIERSGRIKSWPIVEVSLTTIPCEPRTVGVEHLTAIADENPAVKSFIDLVKALPVGPTPMDGEGWGAPVGTYEHLQECLGRLARATLQTDPYCCAWAWVVQTYPDYCIVGVDDAGGCEFYRISYAVGADGMPVLGEIEEVQRAYIPIESPPADTAATAVMSAYTVRSATALRERVSALHEGRVREGRVLSPVNRERLKANRDAIAGLLPAFDALLTETEPKTRAEVGATRAAVEVQAAYARVLAVACGLEMTS